MKKEEKKKVCFLSRVKSFSKVFKMFAVSEALLESIFKENRFGPKSLRLPKKMMDFLKLTEEVSMRLNCQGRFDDWEGRENPLLQVLVEKFESLCNKNMRSDSLESFESVMFWTFRVLQILKDNELWFTKALIKNHFIESAVVSEDVLTTLKMKWQRSVL